MAKFYTQYDEEKRPRKGEVTGSETPVVKTGVRSNAEKLAQMQLAGQFVEAQRIGYQYGPEDELPESIITRPGRSADITEVLKYTEDFGRRMREQIRRQGEQHVGPDGGVPEKDGSSSKSEKEETGGGDGTTPDKSNGYGIQKD